METYEIFTSKISQVKLVVTFIFLLSFYCVCVGRDNPSWLSLVPADLAGYAKNARSWPLYSGQFSGLCLQKTTLREELDLPLGQRAFLFTAYYITVASPSSISLSYNTTPCTCRHSFRPRASHGTSGARGTEANMLMLTLLAVPREIKSKSLTQYFVICQHP